MKALVLSGGAEKGAYAVGALQYILGEKQIHYDILCGSSVGSINVAFLSQFPFGQETNASNQLMNLWLSISNKSIYKRHFPFGKFHALWQHSVYNSKPLQNLIRNNINLALIRESKKTVSVGTVSISSGKYSTFDQTSDHFIDAVIGSSAFPGMLTPIKFQGQLWADGGMKCISPIHTAIDYGATEIDVIMTSPENRVKHYIQYPNAIDIFKRSFDLSTDKIMSNDIERVVMHNRMAYAGLSDKVFIKLAVIRPDRNLTEGVLDFDPGKIRRMIEIGYRDAKNKYDA